jgi:hypothetical protein
MIAGGERRLATRTTFELNLFADRLIGCVVIAARPMNFRPPEITKMDLTTDEVRSNSAN